MLKLGWLRPCALLVMLVAVLLHVEHVHGQTPLPLDVVLTDQATASNVSRFIIDVPVVDERSLPVSVTTYVLSGGSGWVQMLLNDAPRPTPETAKWKNAWPNNTVLVDAMDAPGRRNVTVYVAVQGQFSSGTLFSISASLVNIVTVTSGEGVVTERTLRTGQRHYYTITDELSESVVIDLEACSADAKNISSKLTPSHAPRVLVNSLLDATVLDGISAYSCAQQVKHGDSVLVHIPPIADQIVVPFVDLCSPVYFEIAANHSVTLALEVTSPTQALLADAFRWTIALRVSGHKEITLAPPLESHTDNWVAAPLHVDVQSYPHLIVTFAPAVVNGGGGGGENVTYYLYTDIAADDTNRQDFLNNGSFASSCFLLSNEHLRWEDATMDSSNETAVRMTARNFYKSWDSKRSELVLLNVIAEFENSSIALTSPHAIYQPEAAPIPSVRDSSDGLDGWDIAWIVLGSIGAFLLFSLIIAVAVLAFVWVRFPPQRDYEVIDSGEPPVDGSPEEDSTPDETSPLTSGV